jgi:ATP/maltotriose-dependent transcriptional regulator MalT
MCTHTFACARCGAVLEQSSRDSVGLTDREWEVLDALASGRSNAEIAKLLWVSPSTVRKHLEHVYEKFGVHTRTAAVARAFARPG